MSNPYESPTSESSTSERAQPSDKPHHLGRALATLAFVEIVLATLFAPGDGGRWQGRRRYRNRAGERADLSDPTRPFTLSEWP